MIFWKPWPLVGAFGFKKSTYIVEFSTLRTRNCLTQDTSMKKFLIIGAGLLFCVTADAMACMTVEDVFEEGLVELSNEVVFHKEMAAITPLTLTYHAAHASAQAYLVEGFNPPKLWPVSESYLDPFRIQIAAHRRWKKTHFL